MSWEAEIAVLENYTKLVPYTLGNSNLSMHIFDLLDMNCYCNYSDDL